MFECYPDLVADIEQIEYDMSKNDFMGMISVVAKYAEAREVLEYLIMEGYRIRDIEIGNPELDGYYDEFVISVIDDGIYCEKFKRENGYFDDDSDVTYVFDNCNSKLLSHLHGEKIYEIAVTEDTDDLWEDDDELIDDLDFDDVNDCEHCDIFSCSSNPHYSEKKSEEKSKKNKKSKEEEKPVSKKSKVDNKVDVHFDRDDDDEIHGISMRRDWDGDSYFSYSYYSSEPIDEYDAKKIVKQCGL